MYPLSINLAGIKDERGEVSRGSDACAGCPTGFASWEVLPTLGLPVLDHLQEPKVWTELCFILVSLSLFMAVQEQVPGLHVLLSVGNTWCSPLV